jgi:hypothetical protein
MIKIQLAQHDPNTAGAAMYNKIIKRTKKNTKHNNNNNDCLGQVYIESMYRYHCCSDVAIYSAVAPATIEHVDASDYGKSIWICGDMAVWRGEFDGNVCLSDVCKD